MWLGLAVPEEGAFSSAVLWETPASSAGKLKFRRWVLTLEGQERGPLPPSLSQGLGNRGPCCVGADWGLGEEVPVGT